MQIGRDSKNPNSIQYALHVIVTDPSKNRPELNEHHQNEHEV
jgi:hypothetical protein